jgi:hypothetical protein
MYILQNSNEILYRCQLSTSDISVLWPCGFFIFVRIIYLLVRVVYSIATIVVSEPIFPFMSKLFILRNWAHQCLMHIYVQSSCLLESLLPTLYVKPSFGLTYLCQLWVWVFQLPFRFYLLGVSFSLHSLLACVCLCPWSVFLADKKKVGLIF